MLKLIFFLSLPFNPTHLFLFPAGNMGDGENSWVCLSVVLFPNNYTHACKSSSLLPSFLPPSLSPSLPPSLPSFLKKYKRVCFCNLLFFKEQSDSQSFHISSYKPTSFLSEAECYFIVQRYSPNCFTRSLFTDIYVDSEFPLLRIMLPRHSFSNISCICQLFLNDSFLEVEFLGLL